MNKRQNTYLNMCAAVRASCTAHAGAWSAFAPFAEGYAAWEAQLAEVRAVIGRQDSSTKGVTEIKAEKRRRLEDALVRLTEALRLLAALKQDERLRLDAGQEDERDIRKMNGDMLAGHALWLKGVAAARDAADLLAVDIGADFLPALEAASMDFSRSINDPAHARSERAKATRELRAAIAELRRLFKERLDPAVRVLAYGQRDFAAVYFTARKIVDAPRRRKKQGAEEQA